MSNAPIVVIGAGITGVTTTYGLLRLGYAVTVIDSQPYPSMGTSYANGGQLSASNAEVWNSWATISKGFKGIFNAQSPLLLNPAFSRHKYGWLAEFIAGIRHYKSNTIETARLAIAAREHLFEIAEREEIEFDLEKRGILHLYHDEPSFFAAAKSNELLRQGGLERYPVTTEEIRAIEPTLGPMFYGGFFTPSDASGDIFKFTRGLAEACVRLGATFQLDSTVRSIETKGALLVRSVHTESGERLPPVAARAVIVCAGVGSRRVASILGDRVNIYPVKGYSVTVSLDNALSQSAAPTVSLLDESAKIVTSRLGRDRFRVAGTAEFNGYNRDIRADRIEPLVRWCRRLFPKMSTASVIPWTGLRPMTPSMMPRIGRGKIPGVYYNTGHGHLGWTLSAATAAMVVKLVDQDMCAA